MLHFDALIRRSTPVYINGPGDGLQNSVRRLTRAHLASCTHFFTSLLAHVMASGATAWSFSVHSGYVNI
jgi:hypothetical protein